MSDWLAASMSCRAPLGQVHTVYKLPWPRDSIWVLCSVSDKMWVPSCQQIVGKMVLSQCKSGSAVLQCSGTNISFCHVHTVFLWFVWCLSISLFIKTLFIYLLFVSVEFILYLCCIGVVSVVLLFCSYHLSLAKKKICLVFVLSFSFISVVLFLFLCFCFNIYHISVKICLLYLVHDLGLGLFL